MLTFFILLIFLSFLKISNTPDQGSTGGGGSEILHPIICEMFLNINLHFTVAFYLLAHLHVHPKTADCKLGCW